MAVRGVGVIFFAHGPVDIVDADGGAGVDQGVDGRHQRGAEGGDDETEDPRVLTQDFPGHDHEGVGGVFDIDRMNPVQHAADAGLFFNDGFAQPAYGADHDGGNGEGYEKIEEGGFAAFIDAPASEVPHDPALIQEGEHDAAGQRLAPEQAGGVVARLFQHGDEW